ncbi:MAG TPA: flagellar hook-basal body protein [Caproiciproducens sp.]|nr:flagellar hook-basal body protein [Caproiciproducens sp.]
MISSFYTGAVGLSQLQKGMDVTSNNVANASTTGYMASAPRFSDLIYTNLNAAANAASELKAGHGTKLGKTDTIFTEGDLKKTGTNTDYALTQPNQFFAIQTQSGIRYTRNGNFHVSIQPGANYLVDSTGGYVLNARGQRIPMKTDNDTPDIGVYTFDNCDGLTRVGNSYFTPTNLSGAAKTVVNADLKKGWLEGSSIDFTDEVSSMIELQRSFQMNSKVVQVSDEIMQTVNSLR